MALQDRISRLKARFLWVQLFLTTFEQSDKHDLDMKSNSLSYRSLLSAVPFLAIAFYLTGGVGLSDKIDAFLAANISDPGLIVSLRTAAQNILNIGKSGFFGFIGFFSFLWIVISLLFMVRRAFNRIWECPDDKISFLPKKIGIIVGIIILSPFVVILFFSGSVVYSNLLDLLLPQSSLILMGLKKFLTWSLFYVVTVLILSLLYKWVPACNVRYAFALQSAILSAAVFTLLQFLYLETQVMVSRQNAVYGILAALPLFLVWLNFGWTVILYGAQLSWCLQHELKK